ncbi:hypothetical protein WMF45_00195 [Sorangium sp. So ce448]|uniref:hypothetical protein n=1 Tax=Sorangium sp. So ce448 TaxID=3133314 RepID=UPI003F5FB9FF
MDPTFAAFLRAILATKDVNVMRTLLTELLAVYSEGAPVSSGVGAMKPYEQADSRTPSGPAPWPRIDTSPVARAAALARCSPDQREALARVFAPRGAAPKVGRTAAGELVMSHIGILPQGSKVLPRSDVPRGRPWAA